MNTKPTYQLINTEVNRSLCKPYKQLKRVLDLQNSLKGFCNTEIRKTDFSDLENITTTILI